MKLLPKKKVFIVMMLIGLLVLGTAVVYALTSIDTFNDGAQTSSADATACTSASGTMIGGTRDILVTRTAGLGTVVADVNTTIPNEMSFSTGAGTRGTALIQWDGNDGSCTLSPTGLGGISLKPDDGIALFVTQVDLNGVVVLRVYTDASNYSTFSYTIPDAIAAPGYTIYFPFDKFTAIGTGADFTNVGALELYIDGSGVDSLDMTIDFVNSDFTRDFGDLPTAYSNTTITNNGARHIPGGVYFGANVDTEADGQPSAAASGDGADEQGVSVVTGNTWGDGSGQLTINVTAPASLSTACVVGFIDWDGNNIFDAGGTTGGVSELVVNAWSASGSTVNITTPTLAQYSGTYPATLNARFRVFKPNADIFTTYSLTKDFLGCVTGETEANVMQLVFGEARDGEVEDYQFRFGPTAVTLQNASATSTSPTVIFVAAGLFAAILLGVSALSYRKRQI